MQKVLVVIMLALVTDSVIAQQITREESVTVQALPTDVREAFEMLHPGVTDVKWTKENEGFVASLVKKESRISLLFDRNGFLRTVQTEIKQSELPDSAKCVVSRGYDELFSIKRVLRIEDSGVMTYDVEVLTCGEVVSLLFNAKGKFLRRETIAHAL